MKRLLVLVVTLGLLATACGGSSKPDAVKVAVSSAAAISTSSTPTPTPTPDPTPTLWSLPVADQQYLAMVTPGNALIGNLNKLGAHPSLKDTNTICSQLATADDTLARALAAGQWPTQAQPAVTAFITALTAERSGYQTCSSETTQNTAIAALNATPHADAQAEAVRIALGLPGN